MHLSFKRELFTKIQKISKHTGLIPIQNWMDSQTTFFFFLRIRKCIQLHFIYEASSSLRYHSTEKHYTLNLNFVSIAFSSYINYLGKIHFFFKASRSAPLILPPPLHTHFFQRTAPFQVIILSCR